MITFMSVLVHNVEVWINIIKIFFMIRNVPGLVFAGTRTR